MARSNGQYGGSYGARDGGERTLAGIEQLLEMQRQGKPLTREQLLQVAMRNTDGDTREIVKHAGNLMNGQVDAQGILGLAAQHVDGNDGLSEVLKHMSGTDLNQIDSEKIAHVPGMVVDKNTGEVNFMGVLPVPQQYARLLGAGYSFLLTQINGSVGRWAYQKGSALEAGEWAGKLPEFAKGRMGWAAALGAMGAISFWPDVNNFINLEKEQGKQTSKLANQLAPVLQQIKGRQGVAALYGVSQSDNEVIYNARRKLQTELNANRIRTAIQASGRAASVAIAAATDVNKLADEIKGGASAVAGAGAAASAVESVEDKAFRLAGEEADKFATAKNITTDSARYDQFFQNAVSRHRNELNAAQHADVLGEKYDLGVIKFDKAQARAIGAAAIQQYADQWGESYFDKRTRDISDVTALDMILELRRQLDKNPRADRFKLPEGMKLEGSRGFDAQHLSLPDYVMQIFHQHERDCNGAEGDLPERLNGELMSACQSMAQELKAGHLDGLALIRLVGERMVVKEGGRSIASADQVKEAVGKLKMTMRHVEWVDAKQYAANANFTLKDVKASWDAAAPEERRALVALIPDQVLDAAGVKMEQVQHYRAENVNDYNAQIASLNHALAGLGAKFLQERAGLTHEEAEQIVRLDGQLKQGGLDAVEDVLPGAGHKQDITRPLANAVVALSAQHDGTLANLLGRQGGVA